MNELDLRIEPADSSAAQRAKDKWNDVAKPIGSLGLLEDAVVKIAALVGSENVDISKRCVAVLCADNGVVAQGVTQSDPEITTVVASCVAQGISSVCRMSAPAHMDCIAYDLGMLTPSNEPNVRTRRISASTSDITQGPAMTREQALQAVRTGIDIVADLKEEGYRVIATGEMGIGNTTTSTAMACVFTGMTPEQLTGRGAGLSDAGLERKIWAVKKALTVNAPDANDPLDVLSKVGGYDIAGLCGMFLGGALHRVPIVVDGVISTIAAYCATQLYPECSIALLASHVSSEPAAPILLERMGLSPVIHAEMRLGEGTGAACLIPILDMALSLYNGSTFDDYGMDAYEVNLR
ncbi:MAG: nicotinate-nucleotide--dimethylbenzimidazole phosphoribosyltransferase [Eggerthellaceae bacterium]|nr:nicotinate-nucleotide--dimethylbenzimidazole phosphoribosyltransferase [Eggerthellaceae bacterium]